MNGISLLRALVGLAVLVAIAWVFSSDRRRIPWRTVGIGLALQIVLAIFLLHGRTLGAFFGPLAWPSIFFRWISSLFVFVLRFTAEGARFVFGDLALGPGETGSLGQFFAFQVLPTIIFFSSLMAILYHAGVMQRIVRAMGWVVSRVLRTSGAESLAVAANIFVGQIEAPLVIRPFLAGLTRSELLAVMAGGMATIAGGVMAAYVQMLGSAFASTQGVPLDGARLLFAEHLLAASVMAAPAALLLSKIVLPETSEPETLNVVRVGYERTSRNVIDAAATGAGEGLKLALNVGAMLLAFIALIALVNALLGWGAGLFGATLTLQQLFGWVLAPIAWIVGVPWADAVSFGGLLGTKVVLNEFVAYLGLAEGIQGATLLPKTVLMATFALCGFANFSSIAMQIGGIGSLAPSRTSEIAELGLRAVLIGMLANLMTATIAGGLLA
ncbi:MAG TPA: nucleoside transporter C-terminal domain-containing protein [Rhodothermales bacterium]